ncbi:acid-sensing ion channel 1 [Elysia marginata]|uniref:Acid-sensing ion channel 1 n=1 Tax=Elysia marginata TaxID=1093978 RepID=A0AAV4I859_9GAST|nr:acid-sensing ion channel 1 [Elysia marginata]
MDSRLAISPVYDRKSTNMANRKSAFDVSEVLEGGINSREKPHSRDSIKIVNNGWVEDKSVSVKEQSEETKKQHSPSVIELVKNFGQATSMHGLSHALGDGPVWRRLLWAALVIGFAVWATLNVIGIVKDFQSRPVLTTVTSEFQSKMAFPAVTFCNLNKVKRSRVSDTFLEDEKNNLMMGGRGAVHTMIDSLLRGTYKGNQYELGHKLEDMLFTCFFGAEQCTPDNFTYNFNLEQGNCYTFAGINDAERNNWTTVKPGPLNRLRLELDIQIDEYLASSRVGGVKVLIHDNREFPFPEDGGVIVAPGFYTSIAIRKTEIKRLSAPYGDCIDSAANTTRNLFSDLGFSYSLNACHKSCLQESFYRRCSCCDSSYPCVSVALERATGKKFATGVRYCNSSMWDDVYCMEDVKIDFSENKLGCTAGCPAACTQSTFATTISTGMFPTQASLNATVEEMKPLEQVQNITDFPEFLHKSYVLLEIYYESFILEKVSSEPAYTWNKLLGDVGGQLGLLLGFSILTAVEILELLAVDIGWGLGLAALFKGRNGRTASR